MKKKRITYGVVGMMEYQAIIKIGRATLKVLFTDGSMTSIGQNPAKYTTSDFLVQHAIENSSDFKRGRITVVNTIELDEEVRIERNPVKAEEAKNAPATKTEAEEVTTDNTSAEGAETPAKSEEVPSDASEEAKAEAETAEEVETADAKTELEFSDNQEAKDYLVANFGVKASSMRNREDIKTVGATYGVTITFANEN